MVERIDLNIENLKLQLDDVKQRISLCRKAGLDTKIVELKVMVIPSKIEMVEITKDFKDMQKISSMLNDAKNEIEVVEKEGLNSKK